MPVATKITIAWLAKLAKFATKLREIYLRCDFDPGIINYFPLKTLYA